MADITITPSAVLAASDATRESGTAGATITAGQVVAKHATNGKYVLADADGTGVTRPRGIALNGASDGQPLTIVTAGDVTLGGMTAGVSYYLSPTAGGIAPRADVDTGDTVTALGIAKSTTVLLLNITHSGVASA